jgi:uncharacterized hydantoinase/oxoprolinase family protein
VDNKGCRKKKTGSNPSLVLRRMMRIVCIDKVTNEEILQELERSLWKNLVNRRDEMIGHLLRHDGILKTIKEGRIEGELQVKS